MRRRRRTEAPAEAEEKVGVAWVEVAVEAAKAVGKAVAKEVEGKAGEKVGATMGVVMAAATGTTCASSR